MDIHLEKRASRVNTPGIGIRQTTSRGKFTRGNKFNKEKVIRYSSDYLDYAAVDSYNKKVWKSWDDLDLSDEIFIIHGYLGTYGLQYYAMCIKISKLIYELGLGYGIYMSGNKRMLHKIWAIA